MANFSSLKQAIQNYIKENGNKEITGNLLQEILLSMVVTMGDNAVNGVLQLLSNEMIARENADGLLNQALTTEQQRAIAAETKSAVLEGETKTLVFKNAAGQELYKVSVASLISNGLVDVEVDGTNLVMTFHTESGDEEITIPIGDIFSPSNYYTKTQIDGLLLPITTAITNVSSRLNEGYMYLGVADPETIPTSATGKFFYIASQAGTYHFMTNGDIPIVISSDGLYILSGGVEADDWFLETIVTFTNDVQFNNSRLITSGGVFNALLPINDLLRRNYMLAGVADTTTTPAEDTNVFYLAGQGGTYTHFLNGDEEPLVLPKGLTVIYRGVEDDGWNYWVVYADNDFINTNRAQALTSNQQTEAQNNMMAKSYSPAQFSGLGKKILAKNIQQVSGVSKNVMTQAFFDTSKTIYVIQYDYILGENIIIPEGCVLNFDGGSISGSGNNNTITGNNTTIQATAVKIFDTNINLAGSWSTEGNIRWYGATPDSLDNTLEIQKCFDNFDVVNIDRYNYKTGPLVMNKVRTVIGSGVQRDHSILFFNLESGDSAITAVHNNNPYITFKDLCLRVEGKSSGEGYKQGTVGIDITDGSVIRLYRTVIGSFETGVLSNKNSYYNKIINSEFYDLKYGIKEFSINNLLVDGCKIADCDVFAFDLGGEDIGVSRFQNCTFESANGTGVYVIQCPTEVKGTVDFIGNHIELYTGGVFGGFINNINEIGNIYYLAMNSNKIGYLYNPKNIVSIGNRLYLGVGDASIENWHYCELSNRVEGSLQNVVVLSDTVEYQNPSQVSQYSGFGLESAARPNTIIIGNDPVDNNNFLWSTNSRRVGTTSQRPAYNVYSGYREYFDLDLSKPIYWVVNTTHPNGGWVDAMGNNV